MGEVTTARRARKNAVPPGPVQDAKPARASGPLPRDHQDFGVRAGFLVHDVSRLRRGFFDEAMKPYGLTRSQWWVLGQLSRQKRGPMSQVELARHLEIGKAALGGLIDRLEAAGYVKRSNLPGDRRVNSIAVSKKGQEMTTVLRQIGHSLNEQIFAGLTIEEVHTLEEMLARVKANLLTLATQQESSPEDLPELTEPARDEPEPGRSSARRRRATAADGA